jgi:hypothetical protein
MDVYTIRLLTDELFDMDMMLFVATEILEERMKAFEAEGMTHTVAMLGRQIAQARKLRILLDDAYRANSPLLEVA